MCGVFVVRAGHVVLEGDEVGFLFSLGLAVIRAVTRFLITGNCS